MEREKMIEEMIRDLQGDMEYVTSEMIQDSIKRGGYVDFVKMYDLGYRKIPDGAVVLTREKLRAIQNREAFQEMQIKRLEDTCLERQLCELEEIKNTKHRLLKDGELDEIKEQVRKETARETLRKAEKKARFVDGGHYGKDRYELDLDDLKTIIKDLGVEVDE